MQIAEPGKTLKVAVVAKIADGTIALQFTAESPLEFELGNKKTMKGFSNAVTGMRAGEKKKVTIPACDAFGEFGPNKRLFVQKSRIEGLDELSVGDHVNLLPKGGREVSGWIESFEESEVVINRNHRLAGEDLDVEIELLSVQDSWLSTAWLQAEAVHTTMAASAHDFTRPGRTSG